MTRRPFVSDAAHFRSVAANVVRWGRRRRTISHAFHDAWTHWKRVPKTGIAQTPWCRGDRRCGEDANAVQVRMVMGLDDDYLEVRWRMAHAVVCPEYIRGLKSGRLTER